MEGSRSGREWKRMEVEGGKKWKTVGVEGGVNGEGEEWWRGWRVEEERTGWRREGWEMRGK